METRFEILFGRLEALSKGKYTDCVFLVGTKESTQEEVHAVKSLMMMTSGFMQGLFDSPMCPQGPIKIDTIDPYIFKLIVEFVHLTELITPISCDDTVELAIAADHFLIDSLTQYCGLLLEEKVSEINVWTVLNQLLAYNLTKTANACNKVLSTKTLLCLQDETFLEASSASVISMLKLDVLSLSSEQQLIEFCVDWARNQTDPDAMRSLLPHLRLLTLTPTAAARLPLSLTDSEKAVILQYTITQILESKLPPSICQLTSPRVFPMKETLEILIPEGMLSKVLNSADSEYIRYASNSYNIANSITISSKRDIYLTSISGITLVKSNLGIELNSQTGEYVRKNQNLSDTGFSASVTLRGLGQDESWHLQNIKYDSSWTVSLKQPFLLKKSVGETSISVNFQPRINHGTAYFMRNVRENAVNEAKERNLNEKIFNSVKASWVSDYHTGNTFGPNGPIFIKNFGFVIEPSANAELI